VWRIGASFPVSYIVSECLAMESLGCTLSVCRLWYREAVGHVDHAPLLGNPPFAWNERDAACLLPDFGQECRQLA